MGGCVSHARKGKSAFLNVNIILRSERSKTLCVSPIRDRRHGRMTYLDALALSSSGQWQFWLSTGLPRGGRAWPHPGVMDRCTRYTRHRTPPAIHRGAACMRRCRSRRSQRCATCDDNTASSEMAGGKGTPVGPWSPPSCIRRRGGTAWVCRFLGRTCCS